MMRFAAPFVLLSLTPFFAQSALSATTSSPASSEVSLPGEISAFSALGAEMFALGLMQLTQPDVQESAELWVEWHRQKIRLLRQSGLWEEVIREHDVLPGTVAQSYRQEFLLQVIEAYLVQGNGAQARDLLLPLIWQGPHEANYLATLRRLVLQSYLVEGRQENARMTVLRYEQDDVGGEPNPHWLGLKGRILIDQGHANEAAILTVVSDSPAARSVYILARLHGLIPLDQEMLTESVNWLDSEELDQALRNAIFEALFAKVRQMENWPGRINALEAVLAVRQLEGAQVAALVDALWYAMDEYGQQLANQHQLLVGNFTPWFELAERLTGDRAQMSAALYAWLILHADGTDLKIRAHESLQELLDAQGKSWLLQPLYLSSSQFNNPGALPLALMIRMVDLALTRADLALATRLMSQVDAPQGLNLVDWQLRRSRVQILAGSTGPGAAGLQEIAALQSHSAEQINQLILGAQDLYTQGADNDAVSILVNLLPKAPDAVLRLQILFWLAELHYAAEKYDNAARLYMQCVLLSEQIGERSPDLRLRTAMALEQAGYSMDAANLYQTLLASADAEQRQFYQYQIRRLLHTGR